VGSGVLSKFYAAPRTARRLEPQHFFLTALTHVWYRSVQAGGRHEAVYLADRDGYMNGTSAHDHYVWTPYFDTAYEQD